MGKVNTKIIILISKLALILFIAGIQQLSAIPKSENLKEGIVKLTIRGTSDAIETGAGIIIGFDNQKIYIITALHVVLRKEAENLQAKKIVVQFYGKLNKPVLGQLFESVDEDLDLAVVTVGLRELANQNIVPKFNLGEIDKINELDEVITIGHPADYNWQPSKGEFKTKKLYEIDFSGGTAFPGNSGGALLNKNKELIGMVKEIKKEYGVATRIDVIIDKLKDWNIPTQFKVNGGIDKIYLISFASFVTFGTWALIEDQIILKDKIDEYNSSISEVDIYNARKKVNSCKRRRNIAYISAIAVPACIYIGNYLYRKFKGEKSSKLSQNKINPKFIFSENYLGTKTYALGLEIKF